MDPMTGDFIDSSKKSIKAVLLHIGSILPSVRIAYSTTMKETFQNLQFISEKNPLLGTQLAYMCRLESYSNPYRTSVGLHQILLLFMLVGL